MHQILDAGADALCDAIVAVGRGETVLAPGVHGAVAQEIGLRSSRTGRFCRSACRTAQRRSPPPCAAGCSSSAKINKPPHLNR
jgi:hypothetical protein